MANPLHILYVVPYVPNPIRVRPFNLIRSLTVLGHEVTVLTLFQNSDEQADAEQLRAYCHQVIDLPLPRWRALINCLKVLPTRTPLQVAYCWQPDMANTMNQLLNNGHGLPAFDVVHVEHLRGASYGLHANQLINMAIPVVWDSVDCISLLFEQASKESKSFFGRWITKIELGRTQRFERQITPQFNHVFVTSEKDKQALAKLAGSDINIEVLINGVDLDAFHPPPLFEKRDTHSLVVSGKMSYHANVTMIVYLVKEIMPLVWRHRPDATLVIVGKDPANEIQELAKHPNITVTGTVPALPPYLQSATISVAPLVYGAGIQNKILEAMACATPVITTSLAAESLRARPGEEFVVADDSQTFANAIVGLLADGNHRRALGDAGRKFVEKHHNWHAIAARLTEIYQEAGHTPSKMGHR